MHLSSSPPRRAFSRARASARWIDRTRLPSSSSSSFGRSRRLPSSPVVVIVRSRTSSSYCDTSSEPRLPDPRALDPDDPANDLGGSSWSSLPREGGIRARGGTLWRVTIDKNVDGCAFYTKHTHEMIHRERNLRLRIVCPMSYNSTCVSSARVAPRRGRGRRTVEVVRRPRPSSVVVVIPSPSFASWRPLRYASTRAIATTSTWIFYIVVSRPRRARSARRGRARGETSPVAARARAERDRRHRRRGRVDWVARAREGGAEGR